MTKNTPLVVAAIVASLSVAACGVTAYTKTPKSVTVDEPAIVYVLHPCGFPAADGCFDPAQPNQIELRPDSDPVAFSHEWTHWTLYKNGDSRYTDECYISLLTGQGGEMDAYAKMWWCQDGITTELGKVNGL